MKSILIRVISAAIFVATLIYGQNLKQWLSTYPYALLIFEISAKIILAIAPGLMFLLIYKLKFPRNSPLFTANLP